MPAEDIIQELKKTYIAGFPSHLQEMESHILQMEKSEQYQENFEGLFRKVHSLKGSGGTYGFSIITSVCHQMEDYITDTLQTTSNVTPIAFDNIFKYIDILKDVHNSLVNDSNDFQKIEEQLKALKGEAITNVINGLFIGSSSNMYGQICMHVFEQANVHCTIVENSVDALQRSLHEHFDFVITPKENAGLTGPALIAALKLNQKKDHKLKTILTTSNADFITCEEVKPDYIVLKNKSFDVSLQDVIEEIKALKIKYF